MNISELKEKLKNMEYNLADKEIANCWGMDKSAFSRKKKDGTEIKFKDIKLLENKYNIKLISTSPQLSDNFVQLKYFPDAYATCGEGGFITSDNYELLEVPTSLIEGFNHSNVYSVINARSNSMSPIIMPSDLLIVKHSNIIEDEQIHIFTMDDKIFCKFLSLNLDEILIKSANNEYKNMSVKCDDITVNGVVKGLIRKF